MNNMKIYNIIIGTVICCCLAACYKTEDIKSEIGEADLIPKDGESKIEKFAYDFYSKYNSIIRYDYDTLDYRWEITDRTRNIYTLQKDKEILGQSIEYINKVFLNFYNDDFKKAYMPAMIFLADSVNRSWEGYIIPDCISFYGRSNIAIGRIREGFSEIEQDSLNTIKGNINADFWGGYLYGNERLNVPSSFFKISEIYYSQNLMSDEDPDPNPKEYGFWDIYNSPSDNIDKERNAPSMQIDVWQFINVITSHTEEEVIQMMKGYPNLKSKYDILTNYIKNEFSIDIQTIGNETNN